MRHSAKHDLTAHSFLTCGFVAEPERFAPRKASNPPEGGKNFNLCAHKLKFLPVGGEKTARGRARLVHDTLAGLHSVRKR